MISGSSRSSDVIFPLMRLTVGEKSSRNQPCVASEGSSRSHHHLKPEVSAQSE